MSMAMSSLFCPTPVFLPREECPQAPEVKIKAKEAEYLFLLKKCESMKELKQVHCKLLKMGLLSNSFLLSNIVQRSAAPSCANMDYASSIFERIEEPSTFGYNVMIKGYGNDGNFEAAFVLFEEMLERGVVPDIYTYPPVLKACSWLSWVEVGRQIHGQVFKYGYQRDVNVQNSLINMYGKCGRVSDSCFVFGTMENKDSGSWSAMIFSHANKGMWRKCVEILRDMNHDGSCRAELRTVACMLSASAHLGALDLGKCIHGFLLRNFSEENVVIETSLIDMYIKCGCLEKGSQLFQRMSRKNLLSYGAMISGLASYGHGREALRVFREMLDNGLKPDAAACVSVLSACKQAVLVDEGLRLFDEMRLEHGIEPVIQHYGCMVGLLGRAGLFEKALQLIKEMPMVPNDVIWRSLLSASELHHNLETGEIALRKLMELRLEKASDHVLLANMYARAQRWSDAETVRMMMTSRGLTQSSGFCLVDLKGEVHKFLTQDNTHPNRNEIFEMIHQMEWQLKFEGYSPDTSEILLYMNEEEKMQRMKHQSQKLAIAFALLRSPQKTTIRLTRNVRMSSDCHKYTKLISRIYNRDIIVQDRHYFHHFRDGTCSCNDCW